MSILQDIEVPVGAWSRFFFDFQKKERVQSRTSHAKF
jgi:hypothetical protein